VICTVIVLAIAIVAVQALGTWAFLVFEFSPLWLIVLWEAGLGLAWAVIHERLGQ